jgi:hypothetical protein
MALSRLRVFSETLRDARCFRTGGRLPVPVPQRSRSSRTRDRIALRPMVGAYRWTSKSSTGENQRLSPLEGFHTVLVLARAFEDAKTTEPASVRDALRRIELEGSRGTIRFSTEHEGVVHQQWKWPPVCVVAHSQAGQSFSEADLLWEAEHGRSVGTKSLRRSG